MTPFPFLTEISMECEVIVMCGHLGVCCGYISIQQPLA